MGAYIWQSVWPVNAKLFWRLDGLPARLGVPVDDVGGGEHSQARRTCNLQIDYPTTPACAGLGPVPLVESWTALGANP